MSLPHCPNCDYNLKGIPDKRCPECGFDFTKVERLLHRFRRQSNVQILQYVMTPWFFFLLTSGAVLLNQFIRSSSLQVFMTLCILFLTIVFLLSFPITSIMLAEYWVLCHCMKAKRPYPITEGRVRLPLYFLIIIVVQIITVIGTAVFAGVVAQAWF